MRVALLSAGPSLVRTFDPAETFDLRIGVNSAVGVFHCDWWSCGDGQTFERVEPIGLPVLFCMQPECSRYRSTSTILERFKSHRRVPWSDVRDRMSPPDGWGEFSVSAAIALAVDQGATRIDVYGHDCVGTFDVSGHHAERRAELWTRKDKSVPWCFNLMRDWAADKGVEVIEHQPEQEPCESPQSSRPKA